MKKFRSIFFKICVVTCMVLAIFATSVVNAAGSHGGGGTTRSGSSSSSTTSSTSDSSSETSTSNDELLPENYSPKNGDIDSVVVERYATRFFNFLYAIAIIVSVIMVMYVGLKYITGSVSEKAEYKKNLVPMAIGALIVSFLVTIIRIVINAASSI